MMRSRSGSLLAVPDAARREHRTQFPLINISPTLPKLPKLTTRPTNTCNSNPCRNCENFCYLFPTPDSRLPTPDSRLPTPDSRLPTPDSRLPTPFAKPEPKPLSTEFFVRILELKWLSQ
ncbi:hypothetical protein [Moorena sp. SIO3I6]|uniref:hypothetical protein n=1 Tax=Moorena sp. SIO3I6 TaxID=2607831 RepID=UPI0013F7A070|nr:hypothetical protein [Moorena sp. SIO3I6]NEP24039.1 hypothetical protein [Moorena sp. SIO3I6]